MYGFRTKIILCCPKLGITVQNQAITRTKRHTRSYVILGGGQLTIFQFFATDFNLSPPLPHFMEFPEFSSPPDYYSPLPPNYPNIHRVKCLNSLNGLQVNVLTQAYR